MAGAKLGATCTAVLLSFTMAAAQTDRGRAPDKTGPNSDTARSAPTSTLSGCVVRDAANNGQPTIAANGVSYKLAGTHDANFDQYLGKRVEVMGMLESGTTRATSGRPVPKDQTATAGQSDVPSTDTPRDNTTLPLKTDKGTTADRTGRIQVKTIRIVSPNCL